MTTLLRSAIVALILAAGSTPANAQMPPEPLPMAVPYAYQPGNQYWFQPVGLQPSYYPFGATRPIYGRYSWDYSVYVRSGIGYYTTNLPAYPYAFTYPSLPGRVWYGYGW